jgi:hypothetical protein
LAIKLDFGSKEDSEMSAGNRDEVSKMQECISMIEAGEGERAIPILKSLIGGEAEEDKEESKEESKPNFREAMASKI